jgi:hypothetical protein
MIVFLQFTEKCKADFHFLAFPTKHFHVTDFVCSKAVVISEVGERGSKQKISILAPEHCKRLI